MKKLIFGALALTLAISSCKKDDNGTPANSFSVNGTTFTTLSTNGVTVVGSGVLVSGTNGTSGGSLTFDFPGTTTPAAGTYKVIDNNNTPAANEVAFAAASTVGGNNAYESTGAGTVNAVVTVSGGKISISMPDAPARQTLGGSATVNVNANITQN